MVKESLEKLAHAEYWNERYSGDDDDARAYDWLRKFDAIRRLLTRHLPPPDDGPSILHLGSGNSSLPKDMLAMGYSNQTAVDFSEVVINVMKAENPGIKFETMDIRSLQYRDHSFDVCVDKATMDAMLYGSLWDPPDEVRANVKAYVDEVLRVLKPGGMWMYITWRQPHFIRPLLLRGDRWTLKVETLTDGGGMFEYFAFILVKKP